jgi:hypothetical protein
MSVAAGEYSLAAGPRDLSFKLLLQLLVVASFRFQILGCVDGPCSARFIHATGLNHANPNFRSKLEQAMNPIDLSPTVTRLRVREASNA